MAANDGEAGNTIMEQILDLKSFLEGLDNSPNRLDANKRLFDQRLGRLPWGQINYHTNDSNDETVLHVAVRQGLAWAAESLLSAGASVSEQDYMKYQPLHVACETGNYQMVRLLLDHEADIQAEDYDGWSPLHWASLNGHIEVVRFLLESRANALATDDYGDMPIHIAASHDHSETVELFLSYNVNVNVLGKWGMTALHRSAWEGHSETMKILLEKGANVEIKDVDGWTPLMAATKGQRLDSMKILLDRYGYDQANIQDDIGATPLLVATEYEDLEALGILLEYWPDENKRNPDVYKRLLLYEESTPKEGKLKMQKSILDALKFDQEIYDEALFWAAAKFERHKIAKKLLLGNPDLETNQLSVIELATQQKNPDVLWWFIATSPRTDEITENINSAKDMAKKAMDRERVGAEGGGIEVENTRRREGKRVNKHKLEEDNYDPTTSADGNRPSVWRHMMDILEDPQIAQVYEDSTILEPPRLKSEHSDSVKEFEALIARFYKAKQVSSTIRRTRNLEDIVYENGPTKIMTEAISSLKITMDKNIKNKSNDAKARRLQATYGEGNLRFTYIHLPATNIDWMKDLLLRIMVDEGMKSTTASYHEVSSFLQSTWFEIPDRTSESRFMRPHFLERAPISSTNKKQDGGSSPKPNEERKVTAPNDAQGEEAQGGVVQDTNDHDTNNQESKNQGTTKGTGQGEDNFIPSSALYMPFLSFAMQSEPPDISQDSSQNAKEAQDRPSQKSDGLIEAYKGSVVHSSATLDEAYYHFDLEDLEAQKDRKDRNRTQVVTKQLLQNAKKSEEDQQPNNGQVYEAKQEESWPLLRVNQIWIWTIDKKWVISATSHPVDDVEQSWLEGFTEYLNNQIKAGGAQSQPGSTEDMMKVIVDYCIGSYERRRTSRGPNHDWQIGLSIRQLYSNYINYIGRKETRLFSNVQELENGPNISKRKNNFKKATIKAEELFGEIKDIRDELSIVKSIVKYQDNVQRKLFNRTPTDSGLSASYVLDDIIEMESLASRIQLAVNSTLSLLQSEMANFQAEESGRQGKTLMAFTGITSVFLPLSFLSSFFALNFEKFYATPAWVFGAIFGASFGFGAVVIYFLYVHRYVVANPKPILEYIKNVKKDAKKDVKKQDNGIIERIKYIRKPKGRMRDEEEGSDNSMITEGQREDNVRTSVGSSPPHNDHQPSDT